MIRSHILVLLPIFIVIACSEPATRQETDPDLGYITTYSIDKATGKSHGEYTITDSTGVLMERGMLEQEIPHGVRELYYPDGTVKIRERYKNGQLDDLYEYFFPNGNIELKGYYINGAMSGQWRKYLSSGELLEEVTMANNEEMGPFTEYHPNGKIQAEGTYLHGPYEEGTLKLYDESGQLQKEMFCKAGRCTTVWVKE